MIALEGRQRKVDTMNQALALAPRTRCEDCSIATEEEVVIDYISNARLSGEEDLTNDDREEIREKVRTLLENEGGSFCTDHWAEA